MIHETECYIKVVMIHETECYKSSNDTRNRML